MSKQTDLINRQEHRQENALTLSVRDEQIDNMERALASCNVTELAQLSPVRRALTLAKGMQVLRNALVGPAMKDIMELMDTKLGFRTDRAPGQTDRNGNPVKPYQEAVIRDCVIEAMIRGASPIGNEFNVISGGCYLTKEYYERGLGQFDGLTDLKLTEGVPVMNTRDDGALVPYIASWKLHGKPDEIRCVLENGQDTRIPIRVNKSMGIDAVLGKAKRKMLAKIYVRLTGSQLHEADAMADEPIDVQATTVETEQKREDAEASP